MTDIEIAASRRALLTGALGFGGLAAMSSGVSQAAALPVDPDSDYFLLVNGIRGESVDAAHEDQIDVLTWAFGATNSESPYSQAGPGAEKSKPTPFTFIARLSKASPLLFSRACRGVRTTEVVLSGRKQGAPNSQDHLKITLRNVYITSYQVAPGETESAVLDVVRLEYGELRYQYQAQRADGGLEPAIKAGFNFVTNSVVSF